MNLNEILIDIATMSTLLFIAFVIRRKVPFLYKFYIPTSLIAGFLGLLLGPQILGSVSPFYVPFSDSITQWSNFLLTFVFATSFLGSKVDKFGRNVLATTTITGVVFMAQVLCGLALSFGLSYIMDNSPFEMGLLPVSGFYGGHGSAGIMGGIFATEGWADATGIAMTYATIGMFAAVVGGVFIINLFSKKANVKHRASLNQIDEKDITGILPQAERNSIGTAVSSTTVLDPLAFQMVLVGVVITLSHVFREALISVFPFWSKIPLYTMCLLFSALIGFSVGKTKYNQYLDRKSMQRISGTALEFLIASAVATIRLDVLGSYLLPIVIASIVICILTAALCLVLSKKWYGENWFVLGMGTYGQCTGSLPTGLLLSRILDPNGDSHTAESISGSSTLGSFFQQPYNTLTPILIYTAPTFVVFGTFGLLLALLLVGTIFFGRPGRSKV